MKRLIAGLALVALCGAAQAVAPLPQLAADPSQTSVSGLSSGGYMAVQLHVAYSASFAKGAGIMAGGPFYCAEGSFVSAANRCMAHTGGIPVASLVRITNEWAAQGAIDATSHLAGSKVYLFSGSIDSTVKPAVMDDLRVFYKSFVPDANVVYKNDLAAEHSMVTDDYGSACSVKSTPYISDCNFDLAGAVLKQIYGPLAARKEGALPGAGFVEFDQSAFVRQHGMATKGWLYVPQSCIASGGCRVHVALHGCQQNADTVDDQFVRHAGYNRWAESNRIVVLYPQTGSTSTNGCWDWWGYDSIDYARKSGPQMVAIKAMVDRLTSAASHQTAALAAPGGLSATGATPDTTLVTWSGVSGAAGYNVYRNGIRANAQPIAGTSFTDTGLVAATAYSWTVKAANAGGAEGPASAALGASTPPAPTATCTTANNYAHTMAGRAHVSGWYAKANGSDQNLGLWNVFVVTTLKNTAPDYYVVGSCP